MQVDKVRRGYAYAGEVRIAYQVSGEGPPLVCAHAMGWDQSLWDDHRQRFSNQHMLITFDQRGSGNSDHPPYINAGSSAYSPALFAEDLRAVLDHLQLESAHVLGYSMGAVAALNFAIESPERLSKLVLVSAMASRLPDEIIKRARSVQELIKREGLTKAYDYYFSGPLFEGEAASDDFKKKIGSVLQKATIDGFLGCFNVTIDRPSVVDQLHHIRARTLVMVGARDKHYVAEAGVIGREIPNSQTMVVANAGHALTVQQQTEFETGVLDFLR